MANDKFKLPGASYEELVKIIKSYGHFNGPVGLDEVSKLLGKAKEDISRNSGFLVEIGVLESGQKKIITTLGGSLARALEHNMPNEIKDGWQQLVTQNEFMSKLISAIKIRNGMDENTLQSHIAYSAGQPKKPIFMTGAKTIIDILRATELIIEKDGKYVVASQGVFERYKDDEEEFVAIDKGPAPTNQLNKPTAVVSLSQHAGTEVKICINISVDCSVEELDEIGEKISNVISQINTTENSNDAIDKEM